MGQKRIRGRFQGYPEVRAEDIRRQAKPTDNAKHVESDNSNNKEDHKQQEISMIPEAN